MRPCAWLLLVGASLSAGACSSKKATTGPATLNASASAVTAAPLDHLGPDELAPSKVQAYGFVVPRNMQIESTLPDRVYISGRVSPEALANYVREQVVVSHVEIGAARTLFPSARIKGGPAERVFTLEVLPDGPRTRLVIKDVTPPPPPPPGMTDAERWRAAGMTPDGRPLDPKKLE